MGMAASQARFLGLTARKTNTEYEGQQINQQRTTLSNQSANYYNQLLGMSVPVPPSIADFTKTVYTFEDGSLSNSISTMIAKDGGLYSISYTSTWVDDFAAISASPSIVTKNDDETFYVGAKKLRVMGTNNYTQTFPGLNITKNSDGTYTVTNADGSEGYSGNDEYLKNLSNDQIEQLLLEEDKYCQLLDAQYGDADWTVRYVYNTSAKSWTPYFCKYDTLTSDQTTFDTNGNSLSYIPQYTIGSATKTEEIKGVTARFEQDATGRLINVTLRPGEDDQVTYALTTNTSTDQDAYKDAMNQYEYDKYQYDQSIQEINAKIEVIQSQDKNLELRLKQLDTEQDAIQTEMDAVQKVIEKNTESTFKTFG